MKRFVALPIAVAMGLAVTACAKKPPVDNAADSNTVTDLDSIGGNDATAGDFVTDNSIGFDNATSAETSDANAADANAAL